MGSFIISNSKADKLKKKRVILQKALESYYLSILKNYVRELLYTLMSKCECVYDEDKESYRPCINLSLIEHELLFSSIKVSKGSDITGTA